MRKNITYFYDPLSRMLISKVGSEIAVAIMDLMKTIPDNPDPDSGGYWSFKEQYPLYKQDVAKVSEKWYNALVPVSRDKVREHYFDRWINYHREFWGLRAIPDKQKKG